MPELPEVETVRRSLTPLIGKTISGLEVGVFEGVLGETAPAAFAALVAGREITGLRRRGKYLFIDLDDESSLLVHLRMTGQLLLAPADEPPRRFEHLKIVFTDGSSVRYADQRKFGRVLHLPPGTPDPIESKLGPEPLADDFSAAYLFAYTRKRTAPIKSLLLDQRAVAGLGNIYVDEALWLAQLHPMLPAGVIAEQDADRLAAAIKDAIAAGIEHRGVTISHFVYGAGESGENQHHLNAYGRGRRGDPCPRCGEPMTWVTVGGRTSHFCPACQPLPEFAKPT
jgi:formamidopyrimidine-DNA glycosylase